MADDIDIEEHDVLDNPVIRNIFPDISAIKKEISEYYDDATNIKTVIEVSKKNEDFENDHIQVISCTSNANICNLNICNDTVEKLVPSTTNTSKSDFEDAQVSIQTNKIILGSKLPNKLGEKGTDIKINKTQTKDVIRLPKVILQDLGAYIFRTNRYCKDCHILYPTMMDCDNHKKTYHQNSMKVLKELLGKTKTQLSKHLVNVNKVKGVSKSKKNLGRIHTVSTTLITNKVGSRSKQESKNINAKALVQKCNKNSKAIKNSLSNISLRRTKHQCNICSAYFSCDGNLKRHYKNVHHKKFTRKSKINVTAQTVSPSHAIGHARSHGNINPTINKIECIHCKKMFSDQKSLEEHLYEVLDAKGFSKKQLSKEENITNQYESDSKTKTNVIEGSKIPQNKKKSNQDITPKKQNLPFYKDTKRKICHDPEIDYNGKIKLKRDIINTNILKRKQNNMNLNQDLTSQSLKSKLMFESEDSDDSHSESDFNDSNANRDIFDNEAKKQKALNSNTNNTLSIKELPYQDCTDFKLDPSVSKSFNAKPLKSNSNSTIERYVFECIYCSFMATSDIAYHSHVTHRHKVIKTPEFRKIIFYEQCKYCPSKSTNLKNHNAHLYRYHFHLINKDFSKLWDLKAEQSNFIELSNAKKYVLESIYKCSECKIHFLSSNIAKDHAKHGELFLWKCRLCKKVFPILDKYLHLKQHDASNSFSIYCLSESELSNLLYKCTKCMIHFEENKYVEHFSKCNEKASPSVYCKTCNILIDKCEYNRHENHHTQGYNSKDFTIIITGVIKIDEPISSNYPRCDNCGVYFVNAVECHNCSEIEYLTCNICNVKLSENAFILHMYSHNDSMPTETSVELSTETTKVETSPNIREEQIESAKLYYVDNDYTNKHLPNDNTSTNVNTRIFNLIYFCLSCKIAVDNYDKVIVHCQNHYSSELKLLAVYKCCKCLMKFENNDDENHRRLHANGTVRKIVNFDPMYFLSANDTWIQHVFASVSKPIKEEVINASIYKYECRIKMKIIQKGTSHLTVYKCEICNNFIDPSHLFVHVKFACYKYNMFCSVCNLTFPSIISRRNHEKLHNNYNVAQFNSYNKVLINCKSHNTYTASILHAIKQYVLCQCRICAEVVDNYQRNVHQCNIKELQECDKCKLLFNKKYMKRHFKHHDDLPKFTSTNMKIIMFGDNNEPLQNNSMVSFDGKICDYKLYKCVICDVCVHDEVFISKHVCKYNEGRWKCPKCDYFICTFSLNIHLKMHDADLDFKTEFINVINFNENKNDLSENGSKNVREQMPESDEIIIISESNENNDESEKSDDTVEVIEYVLIYKCVCGLHFVSEANAKQHAKTCTPTDKYIKQTCFKCNMVFYPKELFSHLVAHHSDKHKSYYKYNVIDVGKEYIDTINLE